MIALLQQLVLEGQFLQRRAQEKSVLALLAVAGAHRGQQLLKFGPLALGPAVQFVLQSLALLSQNKSAVLAVAQFVGGDLTLPVGPGQNIDGLSARTIASGSPQALVDDFAVGAQAVALPQSDGRTALARELILWHHAGSHD